MTNLQADKVCGDIPGSIHIKSGGFTLTELMVVLAICAMLVAIASPLYTEYIEKARIVRAVAEIETISQALTAYQLENHEYPESLAEVGCASLLDPWRSPYRYLNIQTATAGERGSFRKDRFLVPINTDYDLYSTGKDRQSKPPLTARESHDDIIRANNGGYIGLASGF